MTMLDRTGARSTSSTPQPAIDPRSPLAELRNSRSDVAASWPTLQLQTKTSVLRSPVEPTASSGRSLCLQFHRDCQSGTMAIATLGAPTTVKFRRNPSKPARNSGRCGQQLPFRARLDVIARLPANSELQRYQRSSPQTSTTGLRRSQGYSRLHRRIRLGRSGTGRRHRSSPIRTPRHRAPSR